MAELAWDDKPSMAVNEGTRVILIGKTGSGKSSLGNILLQKKNVIIPKKKKAACTGQGQGTPAASATESEDQGGSPPDDRKGFVITSSMSSGTKSCCYMENTHAWNRHLKVVDTPGLCDTDVDIRTTLLELTNVMGLSVPGPHAILFVTRLDIKFTKEEDEAFQKLLEMFYYEPKQSECTEKRNKPEQKGKGPQKTLQDFLFLVFTHGEKLDEEGCTIEEFLEDAPTRLKKIMAIVGEKYAVISKTDNVERRKTEVEDLLRKIDRASQDGDVFYSNDVLQEMTNLLYKEIETVMKELKVSWQEAERLVKDELIMDDTKPWSPLQVQMLFIAVLSPPFMILLAAMWLISEFQKEHKESVAEKKTFIESALAKLNAKSRARERKCVIS